MSFRRTILWVIVGTGILLLTITVTLYGLFGTETGSRWVFENVQSRLPGSFNVNETRGSFLTNFRLRSVRYQNESFTAEIEEVSLAWAPFALLRGTFELSHLRLENTSIRGSHSPGTARPFTPPEIILPIAIHLRNVDVKNTRFYRKNQPERIVQNVSGQIRIHSSRIRLRPLTLKSNNLRTTVRGWFATRDNYPHDLTVQGNYQNFYRDQTLEGSVNLLGNLQKSRIKTRTDRPESSKGQFTVRNVVENFQWTGELILPELNLQRYVDGSLPGITGGTVSGTGTLRSAQLNGSFRTDRPEMETVNLRLRAERNNGGFRIDEFGLSVRSRSRKPQLAVMIDGEYRSAPDTFEGRGNWKNLTIPPFREDPLLKTSGQLRTEGNVNDYSGTTTGRLHNRKLGQGKFTSQYRGDSTSLNIFDFHTSTERGSLEGTGQIQWYPALEWNLSLDGSGWSASLLREDLEGMISFRSKLEGSYRNDHFRSRLSLTELDGSFQGEPISGRGELSVDGIRYNLETLELSSREGRLSVRGEIGDHWSLEGNLNLMDLNRWDLNLDGSGTARVLVQGPREEPFIQGSSELRNLRIEEYEADELKGAINLHLDRTTASSFSLVSRNQRYGERFLGKFTIEGEGPLSNHVVNVSGQTRRDTVEFNLVGGLKKDTWSGELKNFELRSERLGNWSQRSPSRLVISRQLGNLAETCLKSDNSTSCVNIRRDTGEWTGNLRTVDLPASRINPFLRETIRTSGNIDLNFSGQYFNSRSARLTGKLTLNRGVLEYASDDKTVAETIPLRSNSLDVSLDTEALSVRLDSDFDEFGHLKGHVRVDTPLPLSSLAKQDFDYRLTGSLTNLRFLHLWTDAVYWKKGGLKVDVSGTGPMNNPRIHGHARLDTGRVRLADQGITVNQVTGDLQANGKTLNYEVFGESGGGTLGLRGTASRPFNESWETQLQITGHQFQTVHTDNLKLSTSPDLDLSLEFPDVVLRGRMKLPKVNLQQLTNLSRDVVSRSDDVRYVDSNEGNNSVLLSENRWNFDSQVTLILGDNVRVREGGFSGRLGGSVVLTEKPNQPTLARGEFEIIEGTYQAYGRTLTIRSGRIIFSRTPPENPRLEIEAVRNLRDVVAGVRVKGTAEQPVLTLFSEPPMEESDILSYIVLGQPATGATGDRRQLLLQAVTAAGFQGGNQLISTLEERLGLETLQLRTEGSLEEGSIAIGRYLSPRLYVSYGMGLFENEDQIMLRYEFDDNWTLEAEGGQHSSADLFYRFNP